MSEENWLSTPLRKVKQKVAEYNSISRIWRNGEHDTSKPADVQILEKEIRKLEAEKVDLLNLLEMKEEKIKDLEPLCLCLTKEL